MLAEAPVTAVEPQVGAEYPTTENLGLAKPPDDADDWGDDIRRAMEILDAHPGVRAFAPGERPSVPFDGQVILEQGETPALLAYDAAAETWKATGQPGPVGGGYTHTQTVASTTWTVVHNLGFKPAGFFVRSTDGTVHVPEVAANTTSATVLSFTDPITGTADVS